MSVIEQISLKDKCISEFLGTGLFLLMGMGCVAALKLTGASYGQWEISIIWGLAVALGVYLTAGVSGAHLNPAVTVAFWLFSDFDRRYVLPYIIAQTLGAFCAAVLVYIFYHGSFINIEETTGIVRGSVESIAHAGSFTTFPNPNISTFTAFAVEIVITSMLVGLIFAISDGNNGVPRGALAPLLIGLVVAVIGASFGPLTGFAMNPARDFGPRIFAVIAGWGSPALTGAREIPYFLIPIAGPIIGGCLGAWIYTRMIGCKLPKVS